VAITRLSLEQIGPLTDAEFNLVGGVNVLLGPNGTGKTIAAKALYALMKGLSDEVPPGTPAREAVRAKLAGVFRPDGGEVRRLVSRTQGKARGRVRVDFDDRESIRLTISTAARTPIAALDYPKHDDEPSVPGPSLFLPSREVLAMYEGFAAAYKQRELSFDETYYDTVLALSAAALRGPSPGKLKEVKERLEREMGGQVRLEGARFYLHRRAVGRLEAHLLAEGTRKIGSIVHLIANGALRQGGLLIWDEPEANLHPRLAEVVVDCLLALAEGGVQVLIATHDYLVADAVSRAAEYRSITKSKASVRFFQLGFQDDGGVGVESADTFAALESNPLLDAFVEHHDREQDLIVQSLERR